LTSVDAQKGERSKIRKIRNRHVSRRKPAPQDTDNRKETSSLQNSPSLSLSLKVTRDHTTKEEDIFHIEIQGKESEAKKETQLAQYQHHHVAVHFFTSLLLFIYVIVSVFIFFSEKMQSIFVFVFVINRSSSTSSSSLQNASNVIICRAGLESETERTRRVDWQRGNRSENQSG